MKVCAHCNQPIRDSVSRGKLLVERAPGRAYWAGLRIDGLTPIRCEILYLLAQLGRVSHTALELCAGTSGSIKVQIYQIRRTLAAADIPLEIRNIHGEGYELVNIDNHIEGEKHGPATPRN